MAEVRFVVMKCNGEWKVVAGNARRGPYASRSQAIDAAIELADQAGRDGRDAQVLVRGDDRQLLIEWTYGRDPYPELIPLAKTKPYRAPRKKPAPKPQLNVDLPPASDLVVLP